MIILDTIGDGVRMPKMKSHITIVAEPLHAAFKAAAKGGEQKLTVQALSELGMLLVLVERGQVTSMQQALDLGARPLPAVLLGRILTGKDW